MSMIISVLIIIVWLAVVPVCMGMPFAKSATGRWNRIELGLICGYMGMWALFQVTAVFFILTTGSFDHVVYTFMALAGIVSVIGILLGGRGKKSLSAAKKAAVPWKMDHKTERLNSWIGFGVWCAFFLLVCFQLAMSVLMAFGDGDDAFYIPISAATEASGSLYHIIPYTGETTALDVRHGLAPFPVWISFLSRVSGIHATILAQSILGGVLLVVCYMIYHQLAEALFEDKREGIPYFMLFAALMHLFGNYSMYTAATFLMTRTSQGKAVLANLILPFLVLCILQLGKEYKKDRDLAHAHRRSEKESDRRKIQLSVQVLLATGAALLCSSLSTFLCAVIIGISGCVFAVAYRSRRALIQAAACAIPCGAFAVFYLLLQ